MTLKIIRQEGDLVLVQFDRNKYQPHQGRREKARRLKQRINGTLVGKTDVARDADLIQAYLELKR